MQAKRGAAKKMTYHCITCAKISLYTISVAFAIFCFSAIIANMDDTLVTIIPKLVLGLVAAIVAITLLMICYFISRKFMTK